MSRSGLGEYDGDDPLAEGRWIAALNRAKSGKRGQAFFREALAVLDAMPDKRLVRGALTVDGMDLDYDEPVIVGADVLHDRFGSAIPMGCHCLLGAVGASRGMSMDHIDPHDMPIVAEEFDIAESLARVIVDENDCTYVRGETPEARWQRMRAWIAKQIKS